jgi:hypothetical protein
MSYLVSSKIKSPKKGGRAPSWAAIATDDDADRYYKTHPVLIMNIDVFYV